MTTDHKSRMRRVVVGVLAPVVLGLVAAPTWALGPGAPPSITYAAAYVSWFSTNAYVAMDENTPRLEVGLDVEIPGGASPRNVASVMVTLPDGVTSFPLIQSQNDMWPEISYWRNLTEAGVVGFPAGTYTFTVTDTAGGVSTVTDNLGTTSGLAPTTAITVSGAQQVSPPPGVVYVLNLASNPTPTVSWNAVPGGVHHRLRIRPFGGPDIYDRTFSPSTTSMPLPGGLLAPGRLYRVLVEADEGVSYLPATNARSRREIRVITEGPEVFLTFNTGTYAAGQTLNVTTRIFNTGPSVTVNAQAWIGLPTGGVIPILTMPNLMIPNSTGNPTGPNNFYNGTIGFSYTFTGGEPGGVYVVGLRLTDPVTGETVAVAYRTFAK